MSTDAVPAADIGMPEAWIDLGTWMCADVFLRYIYIYI
jgi:hypothetical protein